MNVLRTLIPANVRQLIKRVLGRGKPVSDRYIIVTGDPVSDAPASTGWQQPSVAHQQHACFQKLVAGMKGGRPREDFIALARALQTAAVDSPDVIELGCGSGWNKEVIATLYGKPFSYIGLDISGPMIELAKACYPDAKFLVGDAMRTPFPDRACDILISGTLLMHQAEYFLAIQECVRLTRQWCVFHTVPVMQHRATTFLKKMAYGQPTIEVLYNEGELVAEFTRAGLSLVGRWDSLPYNLHKVVGENTATRTYLCQLAP